jgi:hypothetical protein
VLPQHSKGDGFFVAVMRLREQHAGAGAQQQASWWRSRVPAASALRLAREVCATGHPPRAEVADGAAHEARDSLDFAAFFGLNPALTALRGGGKGHDAGDAGIVVSKAKVTVLLTKALHALLGHDRFPHAHAGQVVAKRQPGSGTRGWIIEPDMAAWLGGKMQKRVVWIDASADWERICRAALDGEALNGEAFLDVSAPGCFLLAHVSPPDGPQRHAAGPQQHATGHGEDGRKKRMSTAERKKLKKGSASSSPVAPPNSAASGLTCSSAALPPQFLVGLFDTADKSHYLLIADEARLVAGL